MRAAAAIVGLLRRCAPTGCLRRSAVVAREKGFLAAQYDRLGTRVTLVDPGTTQ